MTESFGAPPPLPTGPAGAYLEKPALPLMPSELLLIAKDPLIGKALVKWGMAVQERVGELEAQVEYLASKVALLTGREIQSIKAEAAEGWL